MPHFLYDPISVEYSKPAQRNHLGGRQGDVSRDYKKRFLFLLVLVA
jgi:hypothetical protein